MHCPACGSPGQSGNRFCSSCGSALPAGPKGGRGTWWIAAGVGVALIGIAVGVILGTRDGDSPEADAAPTSTAAPTVESPVGEVPESEEAAASTVASTTTTIPAVTTVALAPGPAGVAALAPGLFCRDLDAMGYPYDDAVAYWFLEGSPDRMDADRNGIPCETVYPSTDIAYFYDLPELES